MKLITIDNELNLYLFMILKYLMFAEGNRNDTII